MDGKSILCIVLINDKFASFFRFGNNKIIVQTYLYIADILWRSSAIAVLPIAGDGFGTFRSVVQVTLQSPPSTGPSVSVPVACVCAGLSVVRSVYQSQTILLSERYGSAEFGRLAAGIIIIKLKKKNDDKLQRVWGSLISVIRYSLSHISLSSESVRVSSAFSAFFFCVCDQ